MKKLLFELQAEEIEKTLEEFLQEERETEPKFQDLSDLAIIKLALIPPGEFDLLSSNLETIEEKLNKA